MRAQRRTPAVLHSMRGDRVAGTRAEVAPNSPEARIPWLKGRLERLGDNDDELHASALELPQPTTEGSAGATTHPEIPTRCPGRRIDKSKK
ncbi:hypothetical protein AB0C34_22500 [Nocardia sp. NPDC049220]|uniref:hypothetical protein n=1 Tax=Nocardia sp. NPDC049220 TaxID=3155273 RepID=UPI0033D318C6